MEAHCLTGQLKMEEEQTTGKMKEARRLLGVKRIKQGRKDGGMEEVIGQLIKTWTI